MVTIMQKLNLPDINARTRLGSNGKSEIFDEIRRKFVRLTPEEWVRQHFLHYMIIHLGFPASLIVVEASLIYNKMKKRFDVVAYNNTGKPMLIVECKAPEVKITQSVFDQVAMYNMTMKVGYLLVTNGLTHYACQIDHDKRSFAFLPELPKFEELK
jgi:hypothetical protein